MTEWDIYYNELNKSKYSDYRYDGYLPEFKTEDNLRNRLMSCYSDNIKDSIRNKNYNRFKTMGKLSKYNTYKFVTDDRNFKIKKYKHNMKRKTIKQLINKYHKNSLLHIESGIPLPITKHSKLVGILEGKQRTSKSFSNYIYNKCALMDLFNLNFNKNYLESNSKFIKTFSGDWQHASKIL